ncbi:MAG: hypothetical protein M1826_005420 [Phylliscum demangeonii]|nr:MAG: hypothetical protein M1826_005420 [Phylliscum demangeonii]
MALVEDPNLLLTIRPGNSLTDEALLLKSNEKRHIPPSETAAISREVTPSEFGDAEQEGSETTRLLLTFKHRPKDIQRGFVFGSDKNICDVLLAKNYIRSEETPGVDGYVPTWYGGRL